MKRVLPTFAYVLFILLSAIHVGYGQYPDSTRCKIFLKDKKTEIVGFIIKETEDSTTVFSNLLGVINIANVDIYKSKGKRSEVTLNKNLGYLESYLLTENAFTLKKNDFLISTSDLYLNKIGFGLTNSISLDVGSNLITLNQNEGAPGLYAGLKYSKEISKDLRIAGRLLGGLVIESFSIRPEILVTYGSLYNNITANVYLARNFVPNSGIIYSSFRNNNKVHFSLSGRHQLSKNRFLMVENLYFGKSESVMTVLLAKTNSHYSFHYGLSFLGNFRNFQTFILPILGFKIHF